MKRWLSLLTLFAVVLWALPVLATSPALVPLAPKAVDSIIARMQERNPSLDSYRSRVHVSVRMLNFPYLAPKLDGTSYFLRPNNYEVVFDRVPHYAKGFARLFSDVGDAGTWQKANVVSYEGMRSLHGQPMLVLRLTKKIHSSILDHTTAYVDPKTFELVEMQWHYTSGGTITMQQQYRREGGFTVLAAQHAVIDIPHVHAIAESTYAPYQTNVAVASTVFSNR